MFLSRGFYSSMLIICMVMQLVNPFQREIFNFCLQNKIQEFDIANTVATDDIGFILEVDLKYPVHLHESHNDYPLAAEKVKITQDTLSSYLKSLLNKYSSSEKLEPNLNDKIIMFYIMKT